MKPFALVAAVGGLALSAQGQGAAVTAATVQPGAYTVLAWSELGMHCMDGKDYSIFSVLPPYNTVHAQVVKRGEPPVLVSQGITLTYEAITDAAGSINTSSADKTNFWYNIVPLFQSNAAPDVGLTGNEVQSLAPQPMAWNASLGVFEATGIPTVPYDDKNLKNAYPMGRIVARDATGKPLASATVVLAVSDEMTCKQCHASGSDPAAKPAGGWVNAQNAAKNVKLNILRKHDERWDITPYLGALQDAGYSYRATLYETAQAGTPILCAACHGTNALGAPGVPGVRPLTQDMHTLHGPVMNLKTKTTLDNATTPFASCYLCHPGKVTKCQRGAMNKVACYGCHGNVSRVGSAGREGWLHEPSCQMCHNGGMRYPTTFDSSGLWRTSADATFATNPGKPMAGTSLYRFSTGHGALYCSACHGSQHAEYPTTKANDNAYSAALQGHGGTLAECWVCHTATPTTRAGGPHAIHTIGQSWVNDHHRYAENGGYTTCAYCHGANYTGLFLSRTAAARSFRVEDGTKTLAAGHAVTCYDCHDGPTGD